MVLSAGFGESGRADLESELIAIAQHYALTLVGPNCLGAICPSHRLNASFAPLMPLSGNVAFISQSGALCSSVLDYAQHLGLGFSKFISIGNKAQIGELELLKYLYYDPETRVIMMYVEDLDDSAQILQLAHRMTQGRRRKPIIMLKSGRSAAGAAASASHTGALAGHDVAYTALCQQSGIIRVESIEEMFSVADAFSDNQHLLRGKQIAVITNAGGPGVLSADALSAHQLQLAQLTPNTQQRLARYLPAAASSQNPIDILGDADAIRYRTALELTIADPHVDGVLVLLTPQSMTEVDGTARAIAQLKRQTTKPIVVSLIGHDLVAQGRTILTRAGVTTTTFPDSAISALTALHQFRVWQTPHSRAGFSFHDFDPTIISQDLQQVSTQVLDVEQSFKVLHHAKIPAISSTVLQSLSQAITFTTTASKQHHYVLKALSPQIIHKSDVGAVKLDVPLDQVPTAFRQLLRSLRRQLPQAKLQGVQVTPYVTEPGLDLIVGGITDPHLGKLILVGWGGIYAEILKDVAWGLAPLERFDAKRMVNELKAHQLLRGVRHQAVLDEAALIELLGRVSVLLSQVPEISELDLNPVRVLKKGQGLVVLDARVVKVVQ